MFVQVLLSAVPGGIDLTDLSNLAPIDDAELLEECAKSCAILREQIGRIVVGQRRVIDSMLVTLLARGHALFVGVPGLAKTLLVGSLSKCLDMSFGRVQFTPDLLPADITGTDVLNDVEVAPGRVRREIEFLPGPIFRHLVLADEINRTPPKTQAALLQAMQERQVTVGGHTHLLPDPFHVFATRNPIEQEGTYLLPEAQLDRFLLEIYVEYPSEHEEREIAHRTTSGGLPTLSPVVSIEAIRQYGALVPRIPITQAAVELAVRLTRATRPGVKDAQEDVNRYVRFGAGPRGSQALVLAAKARAAMLGEAAADVDDVTDLAIAALRHRLVLGYRAEADGVTDEQMLRAVGKHCGVTLPLG
jgi:MoxR-like ATPase